MAANIDVYKYIYIYIYMYRAKKISMLNGTECPGDNSSLNMLTVRKEISKFWAQKVQVTIVP